MNKKYNNTDTDILTRNKVKTPSMYAVILINDDYTPMEFVIYILQKIFKKEYEEAKHIMLLVHNKGKGICGVFPLDIAESKANQVIEYARLNQHPLECKVQKQ